MLLIKFIIDDIYGEDGFYPSFSILAAKVDKIMISCSFLTEKLNKVIIIVSVLSYLRIKCAVLARPY